MFQWRRKTHLEFPKICADFMNIIDRVRGSIRARIFGGSQPVPTPSEYGTSRQFGREFRSFAKQHSKASRSELLDWDDRYPCLKDKTAETPFDRHYLYHPAWAARVLARTRPKRHIDVSSSLSFCTIVSAFLPVSFYDFRPAPIVLNNLYCGQADLTSLPFEDGSVESLSCMHVIEHIGLGRYGDPLDACGDLKALAELARVLKQGGDLLVAVPVGRSRIQFNAHRIYDHIRFREYLGGLRLVEFALIPDGPVPDGYLVGPEDELVRGQEYGCGCYWFRRD